MNTIYIFIIRWEKNPPEGKIIECYFENNCWHFMRFREDKENANHESIVKKIIKSIEDNVEKDEVCINIFNNSNNNNSNNLIYIYLLIFIFFLFLFLFLFLFVMYYL